MTGQHIFVIIHWVFFFFVTLRFLLLC